MSNKIKRLYVEKFKGFKNFDMELNENITVLVGENGTGKTTILEIIYNVLSGNTDFFTSDSNFVSVSLELNSGNTIKFIKKDDKVQIYVNNKIAQNDNEIFIKQNAIYFPAEGTYKKYEINGPAKIEIEDKNVVLNAEKISKDLKQFLINEKYQDLNDIAAGKEKANKKFLEALKLTVEEMEERFKDGFEYTSMYNVPIVVDTLRRREPINWTQFEGIKS